MIIRKTWFQLLASMYFALALPLASFILFQMEDVHINILFQIILMILSSSAYFYFFKKNKTKTSTKLFLFLGVSILGIQIAYGLCVHPDLMRSAFHTLASLLIIYFYKKGPEFAKEHKKENIKIMAWVSLAILFASFLWVVMYGYHGIILKTNDSENWIIFNVYNMIFILFGISITLFLNQLLYKKVQVSNTQVIIDNIDYSQLLGEKDILLLFNFINQTTYSLCCSQILSDQNSRKQISANCRECIDQRFKATQCSDYKRFYNQILKLKKFLETMRIGTILPPQNKMDVVYEGWSFLAFDKIKLESIPP